MDSDGSKMNFKGSGSAFFQMKLLICLCDMSKTKMITTTKS